VSLRGMLLALWIFPSLPAALLRPFYGIVMWTIISLTSIQWYTYSALQVPWALVVALPTILGAILFARGWKNLFTIEVYLLTILWVWFTATTINCSTTPFLAEHASWAWFRWGFVSKVLLMTMITIVAVDSFARVQTLVKVIAGCFGVFVVKCLPFLLFRAGEDRVYGPENSMLADNNDFGLALNMTLPLFFFLALNETRPWLRKTFWALTVATLPAIFFTYSRGALVGLVAIVGLMTLQFKQRRFLIPLFLIAGLFTLLLAPDKWKQRMDPTRQDAMDGSAYSRINAWTFSWRLAQDFPIMGGGFETFTKELFVVYAPTPRDVHGPHSIYFGVLGEHGFVGLGLYLTMLTSCYLSARKILKWARIRGDDLVANYANMFIVSLAGFMVSGFFLGRQYFDYLYTILALIIALKRTCVLHWNEQDQMEGSEENEEHDMEDMLPQDAVPQAG
jgi:probable O-glycosylation ligase (exosortase A-associated)